MKYVMTCRLIRSVAKKSAFQTKLGITRTNLRTEWDHFQIREKTKV